MDNIMWVAEDIVSYQSQKWGQQHDVSSSDWTRVHWCNETDAMNTVGMNSTEQSTIHSTSLAQCQLHTHAHAIRDTKWLQHAHKAHWCLRYWAPRYLTCRCFTPCKKNKTQCESQCVCVCVCVCVCACVCACVCVFYTKWTNIKSHVKSIPQMHSITQPQEYLLTLSNPTTNSESMLRNNIIYKRNTKCSHCKNHILRHTQNI